MTNAEPIGLTDELSLDEKNLTKSAIGAVRAAFGIGGAVALILGIVLLVWPEKTLALVAIILGINFIVLGIIRLALSIFTSGVSGGLRVLGILFGILLIILGVVAIKNAETAGELLAILLVVIIGIGWIIEGVLALVESGNAPSRGWAITFGIISILAGIVVLVIPTTSAAVLILVAGISLVILGIVGIVRAISFGRAARKALA
jgi:uncharacterized membrane protein HdeD (DUF308 family)